MSVQDQIDRIVGGVFEQTDLLAQIQTALEGKAAGSGGASVETCTVIVDFPEGRDAGIGIRGLANTFSNGVIEAESQGGIRTYTMTFDNIVCGSGLFVGTWNGTCSMWEGSGVEELMTDGYSLHFFKVTAAAGETVTITMYC